MAVMAVMLVVCCEGPLVWRKSTRSMSGDDECVDVGFGAGVVAVRDSKDPPGPILLFEPDEWMAFVRMLADSGGRV